MRIAGLQKLTLLDFPTKMACIVFTHGCNFRCPFCHNAPLVVEALGGEYDEPRDFSADKDYIAVEAMGSGAGSQDTGLKS